LFSLAHPKKEREDGEGRMRIFVFSSTSYEGEEGKNCFLSRILRKGKWEKETLMSNPNLDESVNLKSGRLTFDHSYYPYKIKRTLE
jgi:hypothetical protein